MSDNINEKSDPLAQIIGGGTVVPAPEEVAESEVAKAELDESVIPISAFGEYIPEEENPNVLIKGRWLERGGSAWWISTAGTGKSIASVQAAFSWGAGIAFAGLQPHRPITTWIIQSEDSPSRIVIDREDITAELTEQRPDIDWRDVAERKVRFVRCKASVSGTAFFKEVGRLLDTAKRLGRMPDLLVINPFLAFVGGPVTDGAYVTPFLRGGMIANEKCEGMQPFLERFNIAALFYHHTPKPPTEKEVAAWLKASFPEYQGAGSADITNWGRSFVTMMKCPGHPRVVCLCAGKNGNEIGWEQIGGARRRYLAHSDGVSITGGGRHAWRELTPEEYDEIVGGARDTAEKDADEDAMMIAQHMIDNNITVQKSKFREKFTKLMSKRRAAEAQNVICANPGRFGLVMRERADGRNKSWYIGPSASAIDTAAKHDREKAEQQFRIDQLKTKKGDVADEQPESDGRLTIGDVIDNERMPWE